jgi:hydroxymethylpyrimidine/phosphomethylpyrimidine kinase
MAAPVALTIAGSDPSGGAGIQADLKTFHQFRVYGEAVVALITVQNTREIARVEILPADLVRQQIEAVIDDIVPAAAKSGALGSAENIEAVAELARSFTFPLVVDPVMVGKQGARLLAPEAERTLKQHLIPRAFLLTPNLPEAEALAGMPIENENDMRKAASRIRDLGCEAVLLKGGHLTGEPADVLQCGNEVTVLRGRRISSRHTHGTGCTLSAAITACLALGLDLHEAIHRAKSFVESAIEQAPGLGHGCGPLNHFPATAPR